MHDCFLSLLSQKDTRIKREEQNKKKHLKYTEESEIGSGFINRGGGGDKCIYKRVKFEFSKNSFRTPFCANQLLSESTYTAHSFSLSIKLFTYTPFSLPLSIFLSLVQLCETSVVR